MTGKRDEQRIKRYKQRIENGYEKQRGKVGRIGGRKADKARKG